MSDAMLVWEVVAGGETLVGPPVAYDGETLVHMYGDDLVVTTRNWVAIDRVYTGVGETIHEVLVTPAS